jgi:hypothetical protein
MEWVVDATPRPLYLREGSGTLCIRGWVGPRVGPEVCGKSRPHQDSIPGPSSPYRVAIPTELIPQFTGLILHFFFQLLFYKSLKSPVVIICTTRFFNIKNSTFCPQNAVVCCVFFIPEYTATVILTYCF